MNKNIIQKFSLLVANQNAVIRIQPVYVRERERVNHSLFECVHVGLEGEGGGGGGGVGEGGGGGGGG